MSRTIAAAELSALDHEVSQCRRCPRLVEWREACATTPPPRFAAWSGRYWGRAVPGFGDPEASIAIVGLAPAAHGANRTGRMFTGDRSGDWLYAALYRAGLANQPGSIDRDDGLALNGVRISAVVHCAPPGNRPAVAERDACLGYIERELAALTALRVIVALGGFAWDGTLHALVALGHPAPRPKPKFSHGADVSIAGYRLLGCYHPSQQNTFTGRLTEAMLDEVFAAAKSAAA